MASSPLKTSVTVQRIWLSPGHDFKGRYGMQRLENGVASVEQVECHAGRGLVGDRYYDYKPDFKGQITFFDLAVLQDLAKAFDLAAVEGSLLRRNVLLAGANLNALVGKRFRIGPIELSGSEECAPCFWMDEAVTPGAFDWLKGRGGLRCRIHSNGILTVGTHNLEVLSEHTTLDP